jgi:hypothetical protein
LIPDTGGTVFYGRGLIRETKRRKREETLNKIAIRRNIQEENLKQKGGTIAEGEAANDRHREDVLS